VEYYSAETEQLEQAAVIRDIVEQKLSEPDALWNELEAKGIDTTPGVVHQVLNTPGDGSSLSVPPQAAAESGLSADDLALLGTLAAKAGGVEHLLRILGVWHETPK
jgi:hypothetical protein